MGRAQTYQMKSLQWLQNVGVLKNRGTNLWLLTINTFFCRTAPRRLNLLSEFTPAATAASDFPLIFYSPDEQTGGIFTASHTLQAPVRLLVSVIVCELVKATKASTCEWASAESWLVQGVFTHNLIGWREISKQLVLLILVFHSLACCSSAAVIFAERFYMHIILIITEGKNLSLSRPLYCCSSYYIIYNTSIW